MGGGFLFPMICLFVLSARGCAFLAALKHYNQWDAFVEGWLFPVFAHVRYYRLASRPKPAELPHPDVPRGVEGAFCPVCGKVIAVGEEGRVASTGELLHLGCARVLLGPPKTSVRPIDLAPRELWGSPRLSRMLMIYVALHGLLLAGILVMQWQLIELHYRDLFWDYRYYDYEWAEPEWIGLKTDAVIQGSLKWAMGISLLVLGLWIGHDLKRISGELVCLLLWPCAVVLSLLLTNTILVVIYLRYFKLAMVID